MADTLKAKEQLEKVVELFKAGGLTKTAALVVIPKDANAALICRAVNAHSALVEALKGLTENALNGIAWSDGAREALDKARAALELASKP